MSNWYIIFNGEKIGPMSKENILAYQPTPDTKVWTDGMPDWQPLYTVPELMELLNGPQQPMPPQHPVGGPSVAPGYNDPFSGGSTPPYVPYQGYEPKDKTTAGILALLIGGFGIQYFYLGKVGAGLVTILLSFVTCGLWSVLMLIQGIIILTMSQEEFNRKFVYTQSFMPLF